MIKKENFGSSFKWGVTLSAFQNEGAAVADRKGPSIWDAFSSDTQNINNGDFIGEASDFFRRYREDISLAKSLNFGVFRLAISWPRIIPDGYGQVNQSGIDFYNRVIDTCLEKDLEPWLTLYHWDLPQALEDKGGWTNRKIITWYSNFVDICVQAFGDRVQHWVVMNEPMTFTGLGYFMGYHAPMRKGIGNFLPAAHHATLCMAEAGRIIRSASAKNEIGPALSCSYVRPYNHRLINIRAAKRVEALLNRFFLEPLLGLGYPTDVMPVLRVMERYFQPGDEDKMSFDFDFIGLQYYFRVVAKFSLSPPLLFAKEIAPNTRKSNLNVMNLDVHPGGMSKLLKFYASYPQIKKLLITESGVCYPDFQVARHVHDVRRMKYHQKMLKQVLKAKKKGVPVEGYFVWTLVDNFEWREGFEPRFGLVHVDFDTQKRVVKDSGLWFQDFLK
ncbi:glycosyl hydrolase family protein [Marinilabiliaceae bacterium JC017]|nr:glycosyl hydrolase family protein [Marinilabiliaceae bacterium JC017]